MEAVAPESSRRGRPLLLIGLAVILFAYGAALLLDNMPAPSSTPGGTAGRVLWNGDVAGGDLEAYRVQACEPSRVAVVPDPLGGDRKAIRLDVRDTDVAPCTPTENPRAQVLSPAFMREGQEYWVGWSVLVPDDFPVTRGEGDNWISLGSVYGPPFDGASSNSIAMNTTPGVEKFYFRRSEFYGFDEPWSMPLVRGRWVDFVVHLKLSQNPGEGFREQWVNTGSGWQQNLLHGERRLAMRTLDETNSGGRNFSKVSLYYRRGIMPQATLYFADHKVGTSFDRVAPRSHEG